MKKSFRELPFPRGIPSHGVTETTDFIHERRKRSTTHAHAHGAALDNPDLIVACVVGEGAAETGVLATTKLASLI